MKILEQIYRLQRTDYLIRTESTGCPNDLEKKLDISVSTLFELLNCLKQLGADIHYNRNKLTYIYEVPAKLIFKLETQETSKILGGKNTHSRKIGVSFLSIVL